MSFFNFQIAGHAMEEAIHKYVDGEYSSQLISTSMNGIFEVKSNEMDFIIRFSHPLKEERHIHGEIDFIQYLYNHGVDVVKPLLSKENSYVEHVSDHNNYIVTAFEKASGKIVDIHNEHEWNDKLFGNWGKTIGKMHKLTKTYIPSQEEYRRNRWNEESISVANSIFSPNLAVLHSDEVVFRKWMELLKELESLSRNKDSYGLVHSDLHALNFFVNADRITVFDFDDCCYNWFSYDIALAFYDSLYGIPFEERKQRKEFLIHFSDCFFDGYASENTLSDYWIKKIPLFIKYRDYLLYMVTITHSNVADMDMEQRQILNQIRSNLENEVPYVDFDCAF